jgi:hypothetical protein
MYKEFPSDEFKKLFIEKPFQGQNPEKATIIIVGIDANYNEELIKDPNKRFFDQHIKLYHDNGAEYWKRKKIHHPFLHKEYPLPKNCGGVPYHRRFSKLNLNPDNYADKVSFIELLNVPTTGNTDDTTFWTLFYEYAYPDHIKNLDNIIKNKIFDNRLILMSHDVLEKLEQIKKKHGLFKWIFPNFL